MDTEIENLGKFYYKKIVCLVNRKDGTQKKRRISFRKLKKKKLLNETTSNIIAACLMFKKKFKENNGNVDSTLLKVKNNNLENTDGDIIPFGRKVMACQPCNGRMMEGDWSTGVIGEVPCQNNKFRYLVFFHNGKASYHNHTTIWEATNNDQHPWSGFSPLDANFMKNYFENKLCCFLKPLKVNDKCLMIVVTQNKPILVEGIIINRDCSLILVRYILFNKNYADWIHINSPRLVREGKLCLKSRKTTNCHLQNT